MKVAEPVSGRNSLASRVVELRERAGISGAELAKRACVSKSLISQIERGLVSPSLDTLQAIAAAFKVPVFTLFLDQSEQQMLVRRNERPFVQYPGSNVKREILSPTMSGRMIVLWVTYSPDRGRSHAAGHPAQHVGEECVIVIQGSLEIKVGDQDFALDVGDSMTFDGEVPHHILNVSTEKAEAIVIISPPSI